MKTLGVILGGGLSARMPGKLFLSLKNGSMFGQPLFWSSLDMALGLCDSVVFIEDKYRSVSRYLRYEVIDCEFIQDDFSGVVGAIRAALPKAHEIGATHLVVFCADNIYEGGTVSFLHRVKTTDIDLDYSFASVQHRRNIADLGPWTTELDGYDYSRKRWVHRSEMPELVLTTPWILDVEHVQHSCAEWLMDFFNIRDIKPVIVADSSWRDLGTVDAVERYYREDH